MRGGGEPTSSREMTNYYRFLMQNSTYNLKSFRVSGSQSSSLSESQGQVYQPTLETDRRIIESISSSKIKRIRIIILR